MVAQDLLGSVFTQRRGAYDPAMKEDDAFEVFCADVILNNHDPSIDDIQDRIIDGSQDGGIDSVFLYINRVLIAEDTDLSSFKTPVDIELVVIQSKNETTFKEGPVDKIAASLPNLLRDLKKHATSQGALSARLVAAFELYERTITTLAPEFPAFKISIWYACRGGTVPPSAIAKATSLETTIRSFMPSAEVKFNFAGAKELYDLAGRQKLVKAQLIIDGSPLSGSSSYIVLATLSNYGKFISDDKGILRATFFDANVRDYEGGVDVNKDIATTLREPIAGLDFWWLNNGVTILASQASFMKGAMHLQNPLIVNGLQTSYELHRWMFKGGADEKRLIMVRIVETGDEDVINKIIKATNYQTKVKAYSLRATEEVQRRIEVFLLPHNIYYDRRRNYYKNLGKQAARTIGIDRMAQAVISLLVEEPDVARARPTSLMKSDKYDKIFPSGDTEYPLPLYRVAAETYFLMNGHISNETYDQIFKNNLRFHALMAMGWKVAGSQSPKPEQLAAVDVSKLKNAPAKKIMTWVINEFEKAGATDAVAKDADFTKRLKKNWAAAKI